MFLMHILIKIRITLANKNSISPLLFNKHVQCVHCCDKLLEIKMAYIIACFNAISACHDT